MLNIPNSVTTVEKNAFWDCANLTEIIIGSGLESIGCFSFGIDPGREDKLKDVYCYAKKVPVTDKDAFDMRNISNIAVHVPADLVDAYRESDPWKNFKEIVPIEGSQPTVINTIETNCTKTRYYTINGYIITATRKGFYIKNGSKIIR